MRHTPCHAAHDVPCGTPRAGFTLSDARLQRLPLRCAALRRLARESALGALELVRCGLLAPLLEYLKLVALPSLHADSSDRGLGGDADDSDGAALAMLALPQLLALGEVEEVRLSHRNKRQRNCGRLPQRFAFGATIRFRSGR
jgi:hypothetical protein